MTVAYELIRTRRKSIAIVVDGKGRCSVRAPLQARLSDIERFVNEKTAWIVQKQQLCAVKMQAQQLELTDGKRLQVLDANYTLRLAAVRQVSVQDDVLLWSAAGPQKAIGKWLRRRLYNLPERVLCYAALMGVRYDQVKLSSAAKRWGSCSIQGNLNFAWRLVFYPLAVLDYVVVHELSHIGNMNHSRRFWQRVASVLPDYQARQRYLKQNSYILQWLR